MQGDDRIPDGTKKGQIRWMSILRCFSGRKEVHLAVSSSRPDRISSAGDHCVADEMTLCAKRLD